MKKKELVITIDELKKSLEELNNRMDIGYKILMEKWELQETEIYAWSSANKAYNVQLYDLDSSALYDALARLIGLIEVRPNIWADKHGEYYTLTKYGFIRYRRGLELEHSG